MQKSNWLRIGLVSLVALAGSTTALVACGGDDDAGDDGDGGGGSSGVTSSSSGVSSGGSSGISSGGSSGTSSGGSSGEPPAPQKASLFVVHGFNELGPVRICFAASEEAPPAINAVPNPIAPLPAAGPAEDGPPLLPGTGGFLPDLSTDLANIYIQPYLVTEAARLAQPADKRGCADLIGPTGSLQAGSEYYALRGINKGDLANEKTYILLAKNGGSAVPDGGADAGGGLNVDYDLNEVDTTTAIAADQVGVQFPHGSQYLPPVTPFIYRSEDVVADAGADAGGADGREFFATEALVNPLSLVPATAVSVAAFAAGTTGFGVHIPVGEGGLDALNRNTDGTVIPIEQWKALSDSKNTQVDDDGNSLYFQAGHSFTFIALGKVGGVTNPAIGKFEGPHLLVIPNKAAVVLP